MFVHFILIMNLKYFEGKNKICSMNFKYFNSFCIFHCSIALSPHHLNHYIIIFVNLRNSQLFYVDAYFLNLIFNYLFLDHAILLYHIEIILMSLDTLKSLHHFIQDSIQLPNFTHENILISLNFQKAFLQINMLNYELRVNMI